MYGPVDFSMDLASTAKWSRWVDNFFAMVPVRQSKSWSPWLNDLTGDDENLTIESQQFIIQKTLISPLCLQYPPSIKYRQLFAKCIIQKCEERGLEVAEELYEAYSALVSENSTAEEVFFKTYAMPTGGQVTLQESDRLVSGGTTGLRSWPAALYLVEWAAENQDTFVGKNVLELGCGLGLTGLAISQMCRPASYAFSDCHEGVLETLGKNILLNIERNNRRKCCSDSIPPANSSALVGVDDDIQVEHKLATPALYLKLIAEHKLVNIGEWYHSSMAMCSEKGSPVTPCHHKHHHESRSRTEADYGTGACDCPAEDNRLSGQASGLFSESRTRLDVCCLDWEAVEDDWLRSLNVDIVVAADVIYDTRIISAFVLVLNTLLRCRGDRDGSASRQQPIAILASTIRNEDTHDTFLAALQGADLEMENAAPPLYQQLHYDRSCPMQIMKVKARQTSS